MILNFGEAPGIRSAEFGALCTPKPDKADSSPEAEKVFKDLRPLEQRLVSRLIMTVSFWLSLLRCSTQLNWGTIAVVLLVLP